ncbi:MAG: fatty acid desaturase [Vicinamibacterales bacterium]|nr:fatty acid desaturase [Vicinamibacterales bacterium]
MPWSLFRCLLASAIVTQVAVFSTTIYLHRCATHKALELHPAVAFIFRCCLWLTTGLSTKEWVAVHRKHHAFTEVDGDPHSPHLHGFWSVQLGNVFHYVKEAHNPETLERYARDIEGDVFDRTIFRVGLLGPALGTVGLCFVLGLWWGLLAAGLHLFMYVFVLSSSINGLCHYIGYRNFDNTATNIRLVALLTGGEGLHNNHHGHPRSPKFSFRPREIDPSWPVIRLLIGLKLAKPYKIIDEMHAADRI